MSTDRLAPIAETALNQVVSLAAQSGYFERVNQHEAKSSPGTGITFAVWVNDIRPIALRSGLAVTSALLVLRTRVYLSMLTDPIDMIDINATKAAGWMLAQYTGDFAIDGAELDLLGAHGVTMAARAGYISLDGKLMRVIDTELPFIANDVWDQED